MKIMCIIGVIVRVVSIIEEIVCSTESTEVL